MRTLLIALALPLLFLGALQGTVQAQPGTGTGPGSGGPGLPVNCDHEQGGLSLTSITPALIEGTLTGDLAGSISLTVGTFHEFAQGAWTVRFYQYTGVVTTATGTVEVAGHMFQLEHAAASPTPVMGAGLPAFQRAVLVMAVTGGTGDQADVQGGHLRGHWRSVPSVPFEGGHYRGLLCSPPPTTTP